MQPVGAKNLSPNYDDKFNRDISKNRANNYSPLPISPSKTIGSIVRGFKIGVTKWFHRNTNVVNIWQRNYYENIIRDKKSYDRISAYVLTNPNNWINDRFYNK